MDGGTNQDYTSRFNNATTEMQKQRKLLKTEHADETDHDGVLLLEAMDRL